MATVTSKWATAAPALTGTFSPGEWTVSGVLPMPGGFIHVKNDASSLYLAIDLTNDTGNSPGVGDYFWLSFDVDRSGSITPHFDVNYGIYPSLPIKIAKRSYLGPVRLQTQSRGLPRCRHIGRQGSGEELQFNNQLSGYTKVSIIPALRTINARHGRFVTGRSERRLLTKKQCATAST